jgi:hypothetical protein
MLRALKRIVIFLIAVPIGIIIGPFILVRECWKLAGREVAHDDWRSIKLAGPRADQIIAGCDHGMHIAELTSENIRASVSKPLEPGWLEKAAAESKAMEKRRALGLVSLPSTARIPMPLDLGGPNA